jgi:outer membrane immunogenic protein
MRIDKVFLAAIVISLSHAGFGQAAPSHAFAVDNTKLPVIEIGANFVYIHANAPPSACGCFSLFGGGGTLAVNAPHGVSLVADLTATHASHVDGTTQNITVVNYLFGPRYSYRSKRRFTPYIQALAGGTKELSNYSYVQNVNAFAASFGGGLNAAINRRIAWNVVEADYIYSRLPNAVNTHQNDLRISSGITFRFGTR